MAYLGSVQILQEHKLFQSLRYRVVTYGRRRHGSSRQSRVRRVSWYSCRMYLSRRSGSVEGRARPRLKLSFNTKHDMDKDCF